MQFEISNLEIDNTIYFSEDGKYFSNANSVVLLANTPNRFVAHPESYFIFRSDLLMGNCPVGDGEISAMHSDWHEKIFLDGEVMYIPSPLMFRKVRDHLKKTGREDQ